jgi:hypothetical protein
MVNREAGDELFALDQLIRAYLHQDMELFDASVPDAIQRYARLNDEATKDALRLAMDAFEHRFHNDLEGEFSCRYRYDFLPEELGLNVRGFFDLVRTCLDCSQS